MFCSVVKHAGSGQGTKEGWGKTRDVICSYTIGQMLQQYVYASNQSFPCLKISFELALISAYLG